MSKLVGAVEELGLNYLYAPTKHAPVLVDWYHEKNLRIRYGSEDNQIMIGECNFYGCSFLASLPFLLSHFFEMG